MIYFQFFKADKISKIAALFLCFCFVLLQVIAELLGTVFTKYESVACETDGILQEYKNQRNEEKKKNSDNDCIYFTLWRRQ